jgi:multiple sugar transport system ATP-binding protein
LALPGLGPQVGKKAILGVRPEALSRAEDDAALAGTVAFVEDFGATQLVHLDADLAGSLREMVAEPDEIPITAPRLRVALDATHPARAGERIRLSIDPRRIHLFDAETEHAL